MSLYDQSKRTFAGAAKKGEAFTVTQSYGVKDSLTITEIKDIYTHVMHETTIVVKKTAKEFVENVLGMG